MGPAPGALWITHTLQDAPICVYGFGAAIRTKRL